LRYLTTVITGAGEKAMAHDFADLIRDLDAAKSNLARTMKRSRGSADDRGKPDQTGKSAFDWPDRPER
jgi:hypothetical protein